LFGFVHRTLLEYLCASQILWRIEKERDLTIDEVCRLYMSFRIVRMKAGER
jgi:hypothetical protein